MKFFSKLAIISIFSIFSSIYSADAPWIKSFRKLDKAYADTKTANRSFKKNPELKNLVEITQNFSNALKEFEPVFEAHKADVTTAIGTETYKRVKEELPTLDIFKPLKEAYESAASKVKNAAAPDFVTWFMNGVNSPIDAPETNQTALDYAVAFNLPDAALTLIKYGAKNHTSKIADGRQTTSLLGRIQDETERQKVADALK